MVSSRGGSLIVLRKWVHVYAPVVHVNKLKCHTCENYITHGRLRQVNQAIADRAVCSCNYNIVKKEQEKMHLIIHTLHIMHTKYKGKHRDMVYLREAA